MKSITMQMVDMWHIRKLGYDFMGYTFNKTGELSFHHLIVPKRFGGKETIENGAVLKQATSHDYLHRIEAIDRDRFLAITNEMIEENINGKITKANLYRIRDILMSFEKEYYGKRTRSGSLIIKPQYVRDRVGLG